MLSFRRAVLVAAAILTFFLLLRTHHSSGFQVSRNSPLPTGSYQDNKKIQSRPPSEVKNKVVAAAVAESVAEKVKTPKKPVKPWTGDNGGRTFRARTPESQIPMEELSTMPLRTRLMHLFPYDPEGRFPAFIWQTWKFAPGASEFAEDLRPYEASWSELHPKFTHEVITDDHSLELVQYFYQEAPEVVEAYQALPEPVLKADFFRYLILLAIGGIYSDIDTKALVSAVDWVPREVPRSSYGLVIGIEADPDRLDWADWYSRRIQFCQWTIQAKRGHPVLADIVASITDEALRYRAELEADPDAVMKSIVEFTGPAIWTDAVFRYLNDEEYFDVSASPNKNVSWKDFTGIKEAKKVGDVVVLPITSFSPGIQQMGAGDDDDPMAFVKHYFEGSWKPEEFRHIGEKQKDGTRKQAPKAVKPQIGKSKPAKSAKKDEEDVLVDEDVA